MCLETKSKQLKEIVATYNSDWLLGVFATSPDLGDIFDNQYHKTMGLKNERDIYEKQSGKFIFW